ncbi:exo-rhamnogalacturonan lyase family protein [Dyadobacter psychrotolerans]|uniref:Tat pathway signal sequence domain protein n=1 Tax=Dyadobacter psychrotolerans TaxID=2541721 RepID=A0A4R5DAC2_9BACT|nr:Tat pathway signal sequence domain protein [Dyadobacter psychrotolerans]TDE10582.1 Tat pathway signal sequence domain protein [Dyadobacter psychrotolerans]
MTPISRRKFVKNSMILAAVIPATNTVSLPDLGKKKGEILEPVILNWLDLKVSGAGAGTTWGIPWRKGLLKKDTPLKLQSQDGKEVAIQTWPLAQWPDGTVKWSAHAIGPMENTSGKFLLKQGKPAVIEKPIVLTDKADNIEIDTGIIVCKVNKTGNDLISSISRTRKVTAQNGRLILQIQDKAEAESGESLKTEFFDGRIDSVTVEQKGPVKAVVKIEGKHSSGQRGLLPFIVRLYFYQGSDVIRVMHTIIYDADENKDFIKGIGIRFNVPMEEEMHNRHVRFTGENKGVFAEAIRGLTGLRRDPGGAVKDAQTGGKETPAVSTFPQTVSKRLNYIPAFGDYTLFQPTPDSFEIQKRTKAGHAWIQSAYGGRSSGTGYLGSPKGGIAFGIRNFWQSHPAQLDVRNAHTDLAEVTMWVWAPKASAMDMRFYHDGMGQDTFEKQRDALEITYEDYEPEFGRPVGVARTSEMQIRVLPATPSGAELTGISQEIQNPPQLICDAGYYAQAGIFGGAFSAINTANPEEVKIEKQLEFYFDYYQKQVDQRHWYGFWNYGDVMHSYDEDRHVWKYDVGGFAWDNSELSTDLWLWYYFLRTGRNDVFRMAEAMTRHTGEVDVHHIGPFSPLGSRHNVMHWGCSAKQLRISTAANRRFYYYLTADERVGDLMREQVDADRTLRTIIPGRKIGQVAPENDPKGELASISFGTDWGALAAAWLTEWERTGNEKIKNKLLNSMRTIAGQPHGFFTGVSTMDLNTGRFISADPAKLSVSHLSSVFGLAEICAELIGVFDMPEFEKAWVQYCQLYNGTAEEQKKALGQSLTKLNLKQGHSRLTAFAALRRKDKRLADRAWSEFFEGEAGIKNPNPKVIHLQGPEVLNPIDEAVGISTNAVAQWGLAAMQCLAFAGSDLK